jgi:transcriptional antiterminator RfaH
VITAHNPLFPGYVFLHADHHRRVAAMTTNRIVRCLEVADQDRLWEDLCQVNQLITSGMPITPEARITAGTTVEVVRGPLAGLRGTVIRSTSGKRFVVQVDFIQQGASVVIDDFALVPTERMSSFVA